MVKVAGRVFHRKSENGRTRFVPIPDATVLYREDRHGSPGHFAQTGAQGQYSLDVSPGRYNYIAFKQGYSEDSSFGMPGVSVVRAGNGTKTHNFFIEPLVPDDIRRVDIGMDVHVNLPNLFGGIKQVKRGLETRATMNLTRGTFVMDDIPDFVNTDGVAFTAEVETRDGVINTATRDLDLTLNVRIDPESDIFGQDALLNDVRMSTRNSFDAVNYDGVAFNESYTRATLAGSVISDQDGFFLQPRPLDEQQVFVKVNLRLEEI